jgi:hypothetical protein
MAKEEGFAAAQDAVEQLCALFNSASDNLKQGDTQLAGEDLSKVCGFLKDLVNGLGECCESSAAVVINFHDRRWQQQVPFRIPEARPAARKGGNP